MRGYESDSERMTAVCLIVQEYTGSEPESKKIETGSECDSVRKSPVPIA